MCADGASLGRTVGEPDAEPQYSKCSVCNSILRGFATPLEEKYKAYLGTIQKVMSSNCEDHKDLVARSVDIWNKGYQTLPDRALFLCKHRNDFALQLERNDMPGPSFQLLDRVRLDHIAIGYTGLTNCSAPQRPSKIGRAKVLDQDWISLDLVKRWYRLCETNHGETCNSPRFGRYLDGRPTTLIDTHDWCLVSGRFEQCTPYLALSYVWGLVDGLKLVNLNKELLHIPGSLRDEDYFRLIPTTIVNAIGFTSAIGKRYLWVDALCIIQDDQFQKKQEQLNNMTAIYANASLVIVVTDGTDSDHGLRGIKEVPRAMKRTLHQIIIPFGQHGKVVQSIFPSFTDHFLLEGWDEPFGIYHHRAWTFQEYLFSRKRVVFERNSIFWECGSATLTEDILFHDDEHISNTLSLATKQTILTATRPSMHNLIGLIQDFNKRQLTYEGDCTFAFAGIASALSLIFEGGFLSGLPELFLDIALLWKPRDELRRRVDQRGGQFCLPSWSWVGWAGDLSPWSWIKGYDFTKEGTTEPWMTQETFPVSKWQVIEGHASSTSPKPRREISQTWHELKERYRKVEHPLPNLEEGWTRHDTPKNPRNKYPAPRGFGNFYYTHIACSDEQFWYPIPLRRPGEDPVVRQPAYCLCGILETAILYKGRPSPRYSDLTVPIEGKSGRLAGVLTVHRRCDLPKNAPTTRQALDLIAISRGIGRDSEYQLELEEEELVNRRKDGFLSEFYNVLWISRSGGFAYRQGIGRIHKDMWEQQDRKKEEVILA